jgi:hypothetical protein
MDAVDTELEGDRARVAGIVLMFLLSTILVVVLLRTRPQEAHGAQQAHPRSVPSEGLQPAPQAPGAPSSGPADYYRGWPLFEGWPLPQLPSGSGGGDVPQEPEQRPAP